MPLLFRLKTLIPLKDFIYYRRKPPELCFFKVQILIQVLYSKTPKTVFISWFKFSSESHSHDKRWSNLDYLQIPFHQDYDSFLCRFSMIIYAIHVCNHLQSCHFNFKFDQLRTDRVKKILITYFLNRYN